LADNVLNYDLHAVGEGATMFQTVVSIAKWASIPALLLASMLSRFTAGYELLVDLAICSGAVVVVQWAVRSKDYLWAAGFVAVAVVFSPLLLVVKIFFLMGFTCVATLVTLFSAFRSQLLHTPGRD
jgi:signal transduction histidine kinase